VAGKKGASEHAIRQLIQTAAELGAEAMQTREFTEADRKVKSKIARRMNPSQNLKKGYHVPRWTIDELALLGTMADAVVAERTGRTTQAVRMMRTGRGIASAEDGMK